MRTGGLALDRSVSGDHRDKSGDLILMDWGWGWGLDLEVWVV